MMRKTAPLAVLAAMATFTVSNAASAADRARVTTALNMRAGPSVEFPVVDTLPAYGRVTVYGCVRGYTWCDVDWRGERGWVSAAYLQFYRSGNYVAFDTYRSYATLPIISFSVGSYWGDHYRSRRWYGDRSRFVGVWRDRDRDDRRDRFDRVRRGPDRAGPDRDRREGRAERRLDGAPQRADRGPGRRDRSGRVEQRMQRSDGDRRSRNVERGPGRAERMDRGPNRAERSDRGPGRADVQRGGRGPGSASMGAGSGGDGRRGGGPGPGARSGGGGGPGPGAPAGMSRGGGGGGPGGGGGGRGGDRGR